MPSDEMPDAAFTHTVRGYFGEALTIGAYPPEDGEDRGAVQFVIKDEQGDVTSAHISSPAEREAFTKAWMEACRRADGVAPAIQARSATPGGLSIYDQFKDQNGHGVRVQESGLTAERCAWIFCEDVTGKPWGITPLLTTGMARRLRDALDAFISERQDEAERPGEAMCAAPGDCGNGPGPHPFTPVAGDPLPRPCCRQPQEMAVVPAVLAADDCGCGLGPERCAAAEDGDSGGY